MHHEAGPVVKRSRLVSLGKPIISPEVTSTVDTKGGIYKPTVDRRKRYREGPEHSTDEDDRTGEPPTSQARTRHKPRRPGTIRLVNESNKPGLRKRKAPWDYNSNPHIRALGNHSGLDTKSGSQSIMTRPSPDHVTSIVEGPPGAVGARTPYQTVSEVPATHFPT